MSPALPTVLFVDDEENILAALRRLFRPDGYRVLCATGAAQGLEILEGEAVDVVVSDMRMPRMDGAVFLREVAQRWPGTVRILLTGYADLGSTIAAINEGHIYRYISKPWEDTDIRLCVRRAIDLRRIEAERLRLHQLTCRQNEELKDLNANLEAKVVARTEEIRQTAAFLEVAYAELKHSYAAAVQVFANLVELRDRITAGHCRRVAEHARALAEALGLAEEDVQDIEYAALLHDIGKLGLPDDLVEKPYAGMTRQEREQMARHPAMGEAALLALQPLERAARLIRWHHERMDGRGYPDRLEGEQIPLGARILAVANDYDALQLGTELDAQLSPEQARGYLLRHSGGRYDARVVEAYIKVLATLGEQRPVVAHRRLGAMELREGMVLARDLVNRDGLLLLTKGHELSAKLIERIRRLEREGEQGLTIQVEGGA